MISCLSVCENKFAIYIYCFRCEIPDCDAINPQFEPPWLDNAIPFSKNRPSKCTRFVFNNVTDSFNNCSKATDFTTTVETCHSFVYRTQEKSILQEVTISIFKFILTIFWTVFTKFDF